MRYNMNPIDKKYSEILLDIQVNGYEYGDPNRKGINRREKSNVILTHKVTEGFPIVSLRKTFFKGAVGELLLFLKGRNDIREYWDYAINFWDQDWARFKNHTEETVHNLKHIYSSEGSNNKDLSEWYSMGQIYPKQYEKQYHVFDNFKKNPLRTDLIVDSWQVDDLKKMALIPCHFGFQILGSPNGFEIVWFQRSTDFMLGSPINIQYYFLMGMLLEEWSGHKFLGVKGILNKCHLYSNQFDLADKMITFSCTDVEYNLPTVKINVKEDFKNLSFGEFIKNIEPEDFTIENYKYHLNNRVEMLTYK